MLLFPHILTPVEEVLEDVYVWLHDSVGLSWAWAIIALTVIVRLIILPLGIKQTRSSLAMQRLQPYMKQLQQKYRDDRQQLNVAMMEFYRDNKVNPLASCFPLLIQLPVFLAIFFVLKDFEPPAGTSEDFSFLFGFISDIRVNIDDGGFQAIILLAVYLVSQIISTQVMMTTQNPAQKLMFTALPVFFIIPIWFVGFPIGLILYWTTTNLWSMGQYYAIVAITPKDKEVVLPADSKGRKKTITPKGAKQNKESAGNGGNSGGAAAKPKPRRNRRRK